MDEIEPSAIPDVILKQKRAIDLYLIAVIALAIIGVLSIVGAMILAAWGKAVPGEVWTVVGIAVGALSVMLGGERA
jgi:hypothetical protein